MRTITIVSARPVFLEQHFSPHIKPHIVDRKVLYGGGSALHVHRYQISPLALAASIDQFTDLASKVRKRIADLGNSVDQAPAFRQLKTELPFIIDCLRHKLRLTTSQGRWIIQPRMLSDR